MSCKNCEEIQPESTPGPIQRNDALIRIRQSIDARNVSFLEIVYLQDHQKEVLETRDPILAEWAGIPENEFCGVKTAKLIKEA